MEKVRIAVAGAGAIGLRHIEETQKSQGAKLSAIIDPSPKAAEVAQKEGVPLYDSLQECFAKDRPDGLVLATPNHMHVEQGLECIAAEIPVLVEKPLAHTLDEGKRPDDRQRHQLRGRPPRQARIARRAGLRHAG